MLQPLNKTRWCRQPTVSMLFFSRESVSWSVNEGTNGAKNRGSPRRKHLRIKLHSPFWYGKSCSCASGSLLFACIKVKIEALFSDTLSVSDRIVKECVLQQPPLSRLPSVLVALWKKWREGPVISNAWLLLERRWLLFICMCEWECGCLPACLVRLCVYLFMNSVWVPVCTVPLFQQKKKKMIRHLLADSELAVKNRNEAGGGREKKGRRKKKTPRQPWNISILAPCFLQAAGRRLQNGSSPCHRVGSALSKCLWMENTDWKVSSLLSSPLFFSLCLLRSYSASPPFLFLSIHPSTLPERASHPHLRGSQWMLPLLWEKLSLPLALCQSSARALCLSEVSASHSEVHSSLKHDVYLLGPVCRTIPVLVPLSGSILIRAEEHKGSYANQWRLLKKGAL